MSLRSTCSPLTPSSTTLTVMPAPMVVSPGLFDVDVLSRATELTEVVEVPLAVVQRIDRAARRGRRFPKFLALVEEGLVIFRNGELQRIQLLINSRGCDAEVVRPGEQVAQRGEFDLPAGLTDL